MQTHARRQEWNDERGTRCTIHAGTAYSSARTFKQIQKPHVQLNESLRAIRLLALPPKKRKDRKQLLYTEETVLTDRGCIYALSHRYFVVLHTAPGHSLSPRCRCTSGPSISPFLCLCVYRCNQHPATSLYDTSSQSKANDAGPHTLAECSRTEPNLIDSRHIQPSRKREREWMGNCQPPAASITRSFKSRN